MTDTPPRQMSLIPYPFQNGEVVLYVFSFSTLSTLLSNMHSQLYFTQDVAGMRSLSTITNHITSPFAMLRNKQLSLRNAHIAIDLCEMIFSAETLQKIMHDLTQASARIDHSWIRSTSACWLQVSEPLLQVPLDPRLLAGESFIRRFDLDDREI